MARRLLTLLVLVAAATAVVHFYGWPSQWRILSLSSLMTLGPTPAASVAPESLPAYTRDVAGQAWFRTFFMRIAFSDAQGPESYTGLVTKWTRRTVDVDIVNDGGPGMNAYVKRLISHLNRIQKATRFRLVNDPNAEITIEYLSHEDYVAVVGDGSVGICQTRFSRGAPGLVSAAIKIDGGVLDTVAERKPAVIHELTHALGFRGHLRKARESNRSVLYYAPTLNTWTQNDGAAIRIMFSSKIKNGMSASQARRGLRVIAGET
jgi:hypothetical protein